MGVSDPHRRGFLRATGVGLALAAGLDACAPSSSGGAASSRALRVAVFKGGAETFLSAAGQDKTPYSLALSEFSAGNLITEAIVAGAIDLGSMSEIPPIFVAAAGAPIRLVAVLRGDVNNQVVLVPKASAIVHPASLRGKMVGYVRATTSHYLLLRLLAEQGLTFADIKPVALSLQDGRTAFTQGSLDAWVAYGVQAQAARADTGARVLATGLGRLSGNYLYATSQKILDDPAKRQAILDYLGRIGHVYRWVEANPAEWARLSEAATGVPASYFSRQREERSAPTTLGPVDQAAIASQQGVADVFAKARVLPGRVNVAPLWDIRLNAPLSALLRA
jgi:sulfonate transport system substrate-binding protein